MYRSRVQHYSMETEIRNLYVQTSRTARIALLGSADAQTHDLWIVLHGYRQLAPFFVRKFVPLLRPGVCIAAPEGLSRFYLDGYTGRVGASWMTSEDRLYEIADQIAYLDRCYDLLVGTMPGARVHVLGFSQGVATAWRWLAASTRTPDSLVLWAGSPPPERDPAFETRLGALRVAALYGDADAFIDPDKAQTLLGDLRDRLPHLVHYRFAGGHDIYPLPLAWLAQAVAP
ncbi:MAG: esterase [Bacteroidia bacterium]